jgi:hypothetical protein
VAVGAKRALVAVALNFAGEGAEHVLLGPAALGELFHH